MLYQKKFNAIIGFISNSKYFNEFESVHISNPSDFSTGWIMTDNAFVLELVFVDVELVEYLSKIKDRDAYTRYLNRFNVAMSRSDVKTLKFVGYSVDMDSDKRRVKLQFRQW